MARVALIDDRDDPALTPEQRETFDWVVESRGKMLRPFEVLLHSPGIARSVAELGHKVRFESSLSDHDRELLIISAAVVHGCQFEWDSHLPLAQAAGVREEVVDLLQGRGEAELTEREALIIGAVRELCADSTLSAERFAALKDAYGDTGAVDFCATVGYYTMLGFVMGPCDAC